MLKVGNALLAQSAEDGTLPQLYAATAPGVESGDFIGPDGFREARGHPKRVKRDLPRPTTRSWAAGCGRSRKS